MKIADMVGRLVDMGVLAILITAPTQYGIEVARKTYVSVVDPLIWITFLLWGIQTALRREWPPLRIPLCVVLFLLLAAASVSRASAKLPALKDLIQYIEYFVAAFLLLSRTMAEPSARRKCVHVVLTTASVIIVLGLVQYLTPSIASFKVAGSFGNRNVFGGYLSLVLPLMFGVALFDEWTVRRVWLLLAVALGLAVNLSGGSLLALVLSFGVVAMLKSQKAFLALAAVLLVGMGIAAGRLPRDNAGILHQSVSLFGDDGQMATRYPEWQAGVAMVRENPLLGVGLGGYQSNVGGYYGTIPRIAVASEPDSQNLYLVLASTIGIPGLACLLGAWLLFGKKALTFFLQTKNGFEKGLAVGTLGCLVAFAANSLWAPLLVRGLGVPLVTVLALAATLGGTDDR